MTDLKKTIKLYNGFGIKLEEKKENNEITLTMDEMDDNLKVVGFLGFYTTLFFDLKGKFIKQGIWE